MLDLIFQVYTNVTGADTIGQLGSTLSGIGTGIIGVSGTAGQWVLGVVFLVFMGGLLTWRQAPMELIGGVFFPTILVLSYYGWLPALIFVPIDLVIGGILVTLAVIRFRQG